MYWNIKIAGAFVFLRTLNSNIRCIEMTRPLGTKASEIGWIVTLDVLKLILLYAITVLVTLNSNIRCIEIMFLHPYSHTPERWIVTLDVLK